MEQVVRRPTVKYNSAQRKLVWALSKTDVAKTSASGARTVGCIVSFMLACET